jgi:hypothetical protein
MCFDAEWRTTKKKRVNIDKLIKMSRLQYENYRERFYERPAMLNGLSIYIRDLSTMVDKE